MSPTLVLILDLWIFTVGLVGVYCLLAPCFTAQVRPAFALSIVEIKTPLFVASYARRKEWYHDTTGY